MRRDRQKHLNAVYGNPNVPHALLRGAPGAPSWHAAHAERPAFDVLPSLAHSAEQEPAAARAERVAALVLEALLARAHGLPSFALQRAAAPEVTAESSFADFVERIVVAATQRVYRPSGLPALIEQLGEEADAALVAAVRLRLARYAPSEEGKRRSTPLIKQLRCAFTKGFLLPPCASLKRVSRIGTAIKSTVD